MEALTTVISALPAELPAAVLVVLHIAPIGPSVLPAIIGRHAKLPASHPADGERLEDGHVYVAPPDHHLLVSDGRARIVLGPRENGNRPAADPLFRSVAAAYGRRAAGVVLSGALDDGTAGLVAIKRAGGTTIAQDPDEAAFPSMPANAVAFADPDYVVPLREVAHVLCRFVKEVTAVPTGGTTDPDDPADEAVFDQPTEFTCPECGGTLWAASDAPMRFRCRVGHSFSNESLDVGKQDAVENALWAAIVALEERADLARRLLRRVGPKGSQRLAGRYESQIEQSERGAATLKHLAAELIGPVVQATTQKSEEHDRIDGED